MLKNISNLGKALNKVEQKAINGGNRIFCYKGGFMCPDHCRCSRYGCLTMDGLGLCA